MHPNSNTDLYVQLNGLLDERRRLDELRTNHPSLTMHFRDEMELIGQFILSVQRQMALRDGSNDEACNGMLYLFMRHNANSWRRSSLAGENIP